jgi:hypothetical protein
VLFTAGNLLICASNFDASCEGEMADQDVAKLEARAIQRVRSRNTGEVVGYVYRWNDGTTQIMWLAGRVRDVEVEDLPQRA